MKTNWNYYNPVTIKAAAGMLNSLPNLVTEGHWLLVTTPGFTRRGLTDRIKALLPNIELTVHDNITPNPELDDLEQATKELKQKNLAGILALGGGSVMDAAKVLAVTIPSGIPNPLTQTLRQSVKNNWQAKLPLIAIPTTSGTGAEVTPFATVWDQTEHKKHSVVGDKVFPDIALMDPELTLNLPETETLHTGLDAVSHALESLWNVNRMPVSQSFAMQALELAETALPQVITTPQNLEARAAMQQSSVLAGLAISQTRTAIAHSISYPLTSHFGIPHGLACSFSLERIIDHYLERGTPEAPIKQLMLNIKTMLESLNLGKHVQEYTDNAQVLKLKDEMFHPDRAGNFDAKLNNEAFEKFITFHL